VCVCGVMNVLDGRGCMMHVGEHPVCIAQVLYMYNIYTCVCVYACACGYVRVMCWMGGGV